MSKRDYSDLSREDLEARVDVLWEVREVLKVQKGASVRERSLRVLAERDRLQKLSTKLAQRLYEQLSLEDPLLLALDEEDPDVREALKAARDTVEARKSL